MSFELGADHHHDSNEFESGQQAFDHLIRAIASPNAPEKAVSMLSEFSVPIAELSSSQIGTLLTELGESNDLLGNPASQKPLESIFRQLSVVIRNSLRIADKTGTPGEFDESWLAETAMASVYRGLPIDSNARNQLLACLANMFVPSAHQLFAELIVSDPPSEDKGILIAFSPLVDQRRKYDTGPLFPRLLEALKYKHLAAIVLDLCNFCVRQGLIETNPASSRIEHLTNLLGQVVGQLELIEEGQISGQSPQQISDNVNESVALTVSLCDTIALSGHVNGVGKILQAMSLKHRRVKTEAAAALIRLGDTLEKEGEKLLIELVAEPVCRLRAIHYARELGLSDQIDKKFLSDAATAESQLATWLAAPSQMGVAPTTMDLIYQNTLRWPGFEMPVECFLFRFEYRFAGQAYTNVAIAGPLTHAFANNLEHLSELDILSAFAGWQTQHEDIYTVDFERAQEAIPGATESLLHRLRGQYDRLEPAFVGFFFETPVVVARVSSSDADEPGLIAICDRDHDYVYPVGSPHSPITAELAFEIYKGRQLLNAFNDFGE